MPRNKQSKERNAILPSKIWTAQLLKKLPSHLAKRIGLKLFLRNLNPFRRLIHGHVDLPPPGKRIFPSKFVLKIKMQFWQNHRALQGQVGSLGHLQQKDINFFETYSPVVDFTAVRIALAIACQMEMPPHHLDVKCAFLYGTIDEEIYKAPWEECNSDGKLCRLKKSIHGLKQAPWDWNARLMQDLLSIQYIPFLHAESISGVTRMTSKFTFLYTLMIIFW
jgi:hypothetical protein